MSTVEYAVCIYTQYVLPSELVATVNSGEGHDYKSFLWTGKESDRQFKAS